MAQITQLTIGVDGFTCSLCAKGVEEQFKSLDFVKSVKTDLKNTTFRLLFKNSPKINILEIKDATVFEITPDDAANANVLAHARQSWAQTGQPTHDQVDLDACARCLIELSDRPVFLKLIHLDHDAR